MQVMTYTRQTWPVVSINKHARDPVMFPPFLQVKKNCLQSPVCSLHSNLTKHIFHPVLKTTTYAKATEELLQQASRLFTET